MRSQATYTKEMYLNIVIEQKWYDESGTTPQYHTMSKRLYNKKSYDV